MAEASGNLSGKLKIDMTQPTILIACIGNIFLGDDGFGCEVAKVLQTRKLPENVKLFDYGIRGYDLAYALLDGYDVTIFVDAVPNTESAGTIYVIEPDTSEFENMESNPAMLDGHTMNPMHVLRLAHSLAQNLIVCCSSAVNRKHLAATKVLWV